MEKEFSNNKPDSVKTAVNLLWISMALGLAKIVIELTYLNNLAPAVFTSIVLIGTLAFIAFLIVKISSGKNWARITFLVLFILGVLPGIPTILREFVRSPVAGSLSIVQIALQTYALYLVFKNREVSGSEKYRRAFNRKT